MLRPQPQALGLVVYGLGLTASGLSLIGIGLMALKVHSVHDLNIKV